MIGFLRGKLVKKTPPLMFIDVAGVGYEVEAPMSTFYSLELGHEVVILTHMHVREDAMQLFGFATESEKTLFKTLIKVNGIGAKMALAILSTMSVHEFCQKVDQADIVALTKIPGVGKKTAERLQIEMRDRLKPLIDSQQIDYQTDDFSLTQPAGESSSVKPAPQIGIKNNAVSALVSLGYKESQALKMVEAVFDPNDNLETLIKKSLQSIKL
ncbi:Holliday junction branch migration protein RuvA [Thiomicrorhabdus indica]|uniref:Holliday junction branch migration protein RuvA n=1 Tax=Thiomicrorhabdus indica TaxID=2267253 RepID=UPI00102DE583|nr:Holliday junction branch migration protein RuvA [Thiomicrorhabdus indica]